MDATTDRVPGPSAAARAPSPIRAGARRALRENRTAVLVAMGVAALFTISSAVLLLHLRALDPGAACWQRLVADNLPGDHGCRAAARAYATATDPARFLTEVVGLLVPFLAGLLLVVPVTARAARVGVTGGGRELLGRLLPMLALGLALFALVGFLSGQLRDTFLQWTGWGYGRRLELPDLGYEGVSYAVRGFMALGIGALAGALLRRWVAALLVAAAVTFGLTTVGSQLLQHEIGVARATWVRTQDGATNTPILLFLDSGFLDHDGRPLGRAEEQDRFEAACPSCEADAQYDWLRRSFTEAELVVLPAAWSTFFAIDVAIALAIGGTCLALAFPVTLRRRRPRA